MHLPPQVDPTRARRRTQPAVIEAAHVKRQPIEWSTCGNQIQYTSTRKNLPRDTYPALVKRLRVVIYNGDWDACVPHTDGEAWTRGMGFAEAAPWHPWRYKNNTQVAGYAIVRHSHIEPALNRTRRPPGY